MIVFQIDKMVVNDEFLVPEAIAIAEPLMLSDLKIYWYETVKTEIKAIIGFNLKNWERPLVYHIPYMSKIDLICRLMMFSYRNFRDKNFQLFWIFS